MKGGTAQFMRSCLARIVPRHLVSGRMICRLEGRRQNQRKGSIMKTKDYEKDDDTMTMERPRSGNPSGQGKSQSEPAEIMKKLEAAGTPGPAHKALNALAGDWKAEVKCWGEPGGSPEISQGTACARWILNGRFLEEEFHSQMMGRPFAGRTLMGFDNTKQTFNSVWACNTQTSMFVSEGKGDSDFKVITLEGNASCPATERKDVLMKTVLRIISPDKHVFEMFDGSKGNAKTMEIIYTRA